VAESTESQGHSRRDFLLVATGTAAAAGGVVSIWPFVAQMKPSAAVQALASIELDLAPIPEGQQITVMWRGKPVFVRHRTAEDIAKAEATPIGDLKDPVNQPNDVDRVVAFDGQPQKQWLVLIGVCTHLGCVPLSDQGDYSGWFCPCHGSVYDTSGRIRKGPAPKNLVVPDYAFLSDTRIKIG